MDFDFKVPSLVPQDLLLIQDLIGTLPESNVTTKDVPDSLDSSDDSIASSIDEAESEDEVEAGLVPHDEDSGVSVAASDSASHSDSDSDAATSSDSEDGHDYEAPRHPRPVNDVEDEESGMTIATTYLQTKNEIVDADIIIPTISEVEPCDTLEKVGEIMSIVGNIVIVRGLPVKSSKHTLDAESLLVFEDRKVLGYVYETFGPTSQPLYQVKFNKYYPLDTGKVWLSREVFHIPQRSHFVFVDQLKKLHGSDASNIHDEEPADDEIEFSDDEKEATFKAERKRRRGRSVSSSRQSTPGSIRIPIDDMVQDTYHGSNPYDARGPYDDDYQVSGPSRPLPAPYDDPYADNPTSDVQIQSMGMNDGPGGGHIDESGRDRRDTSRGHSFSRGARGSGARNRRTWNASRRGHRRDPVASRRTFDPNPDLQFSTTSRTVECAIGHGQRDAFTPHSFAQPSPNAWLSPETNSFPDYQQPFIQPHINPRFASMFGLDVQSGPITSWASQNAYDRTSPHQHWDETWTMHGGAGSEGEGDTYRPM